MLILDIAPENILDFFRSVPDYLRGIQEPPWLFWYKVVAGFISGFLILLIFVLIKKANALWWVGQLKQSFQAPKFVGKIMKRWEGVQKNLEKEDEASFKLAVIEADKLFEDILNQMALPGKNFEEKLSSLDPSKLASLEKVKEAHKIRNYIIQDPHTPLTKEQAKEAIGSFEAALKELQAL